MMERKSPKMIYKINWTEFIDRKKKTKKLTKTKIKARKSKVRK